VPRKNPLPESEQVIGRKIIAVRQAGHCSRKRLSHFAGVHESVVKRVELGRSPLRYLLAQKFCEHFNVSVAWLAENLGPKHPRIPIADELERQIPNEMPFTAAYFKYIKPQLSPFHLKLLETQFNKVTPQIISPVGMSAGKLIEWSIIEDVKSALSKTPQESKLKLAKAISSAIEPFAENDDNWLTAERALAKQIGQSAMPPWIYPGDSKKKSLTTSSENRNNPTVMNFTMSALLNEVRDLTRARGMRSRLANDLGVPEARVSEWLSGKYEPSGETTLRLLAWVKVERAKQKRTDRVGTRTVRKTAQPSKSKSQ
jgi:transcriptional regulator with XRE-family HTH domain